MNNALFDLLQSCYDGFNKKIAIVASIAVVTIALIIALVYVLAPIPTFANGGGPFGMSASHIGSSGFGGGAWHGGQGVVNMWQAWHHNSNNVYNMMIMTTAGSNQSNENWTGTVSVQSLKSGIMDTVKSKVKVDIADATSTAQKALGNGGRIGIITLAPVNGYLVYQAYGIDSSNVVHRLIIDVGNASMLDNTKINIANGVGIGSWPSHGFGWGT